MKTTNDLLATLNTIDNNDSFIKYLESIKSYEALNYIDYFEVVRNKKGIDKNKIVKDSGLNRTYCYQMLNGTRKPGRDNALCLAIAAHFDLNETTTYLELLEHGILYSKNKRDSIIIYAINRQMSVQETNEMLFKQNEKTLNE